MADIEVQGLFDQKKNEFKTRGAGSDRFEEDFVVAVNRAAKKISIGADLSTAVSSIAYVNDTLTGLDDRYEDILSDIVTVNLVKMGQRPSRGAKASIPSRTEIDEAIDSIRQDILADRIDSDSDDDTYDNVGLGALD
jgi:hypothetical protein